MRFTIGIIALIGIAILYNAFYINVQPEPTIESSLFMDQNTSELPYDTAITGHYFHRSEVNGADRSFEIAITSDRIFKVYGTNNSLKRGNAIYTIKGKTLVYTDVRGDRRLFPEVGDAFRLTDVGIQLLYADFPPLDLASVQGEVEHVIQETIPDTFKKGLSGVNKWITVTFCTLILLSVVIMFINFVRREFP